MLDGWSILINLNTIGYNLPSSHEIPELRKVPERHNISIHYLKCSVAKFIIFGTLGQGCSLGFCDKLEGSNCAFG